MGRGAMTGDEGELEDTEKFGDSGGDGGASSWNWEYVGENADGLRGDGIGIGYWDGLGGWGTRPEPFVNG